MAWFKVDDRFWSHPVTSELSDAATALWIRAGSWSAMHLTDGMIPKTKLRVFGSRKRAADELVHVGLWIEHEDAYEVANWSKYQPMKDDVEAKREANRERVNTYRSQKLAMSQPEASHVPAKSEPENSEKTSSSFGNKNTGITGETEDCNAVTNAASNTPPDPTRTRPEVTKVTSLDSGKAKETRLPADWVPIASHYQLARERGVDIAHEAEMFRLHAETHDRHAARWNAAFTTWLKKARPTASVTARNLYDPPKGEKPAWKAVISDPWLG